MGPYNQSENNIIEQLSIKLAEEFQSKKFSPKLKEKTENNTKHLEQRCETPAPFLEHATESDDDSLVASDLSNISENENGQKLTTITLASLNKETTGDLDEQALDKLLEMCKKEKENRKKVQQASSPTDASGIPSTNSNIQNNNIDEARPVSRQSSRQSLFAINSPIKPFPEIISDAGLSSCKPPRGLPPLFDFYKRSYSHFSSAVSLEQYTLLPNIISTGRA